MTHERWNEATRDTPCPACKKPDWCAWTPDGKMLKCERTIDAPPGMVLVKAADGGGLFRQADDTLAPKFTEPKTGRCRTFRQIVETYDYCDVDGRLLHQTIRFKPKGFSQRCPDGDGHWVWGLDAGEYAQAGNGDWYKVKEITPANAPRRHFPAPRRILYRLSELLAANTEVWVFIVEGEKDADRLRSFGLIATTNPMGAGKWRDAYSEFLRGRRVAVVPDNDEPGRKHARQVAQSLLGIADELKILDLPNLPAKGDVSDWFDAGGTAEVLLQLVDQAPPYTPARDGACEDPNAHSTEFDNGKYLARPDGLFYKKPTRDGETLVRLTNFTARIVGQVTQDNGAEREQALEMEGTLKGRTVRFTCPASQFPALNWVIDKLGPQAILEAGSSTKDHTRAAIQTFSTDIKNRVIYTHLGWRELACGWVYLHRDGALGASGPVEGIDVDVADGLEAYRLPAPPTGPDRRIALEATMELLDLARDAVVVPVWAAILRAVLGSCDFSVHLAGPSGVFKSELAALAQQHFGAGFDARHLPGSWSSTSNALEGLAFFAKDALLTVDDFAPGGSSQDVQRKHRDADRIFRAQGNRCGRQRMRADGSLCPEKPPRGLILSTGEDIPRGHSCRARVLTVEIAPGDIEPGKLSHCQALARQGVFAAAMSGFICWLAGRYPEVQAYMQSQLLAYRQQALSSGFHRRTPEIIANLMVAIRVFLTFALEEGVVNDEQKVRLEERGWIALGQVAAAQAEHQKDADPVRRFLELLNAALTAGRAHLADREGSAPTENGPGGWGWRRNGAGEWNSMGDRVGWIDGGKVFLDPEASYRAAQAMAGPNGDGIPISPHRLRKRLDERGLLKREGARESLTIRRKLEGRLLNVLCMNLDVLSGPEPDNPDIKAIAPPSSAEKEGFMSGLVSDSMSGSCQIPSETCHQNLPSNLTHTMPEPVQEDQCQECQVFSAEEKQRIKEAIDHRDLDGLPDTLRPIWEENVAACKVSGVDRNRAEELAWLDIRGRLGQ